MFVRPASLALAFVLFSASVAAPARTDDNVGNIDDTTAVSGGGAGAGSGSDFGPTPNPDVKCMLGTPTGYYDADFYRSLKCPSDFFCVPVAVLPMPPTSDSGPVDTRHDSTVIPTSAPAPAQYCLDKCDCDQTPDPDSFSPSLLCFKMQSDFCDYYTCPDGDSHLPFVKYEPTDATTLYPPGFFSTAIGHSDGHASGIGAKSNSQVNAHAGGSAANSISNAKSLFGAVSTSNDAKAIGRRDTAHAEMYTTGNAAASAISNVNGLSGKKISFASGTSKSGGTSHAYSDVKTGRKKALLGFPEVPPNYMHSPPGIKPGQPHRKLQEFPSADPTLLLPEQAGTVSEEPNLSTKPLKSWVNPNPTKLLPHIRRSPPQSSGFTKRSPDPKQGTPFTLERSWPDQGPTIVRKGSGQNIETRSVAILDKNDRQSDCSESGTDASNPSPKVCGGYRNFRRVEAHENILHSRQETKPGRPIVKLPSNPKKKSDLRIWDVSQPPNNIFRDPPHVRTSYLTDGIKVEKRAFEKYVRRDGELYKRGPCSSQQEGTAGLGAGQGCWSKTTSRIAMTQEGKREEAETLSNEQFFVLTRDETSDEEPQERDYEHLGVIEVFNTKRGKVVFLEHVDIIDRLIAEELEELMERHLSDLIVSSALAELKAVSTRDDVTLADILASLIDTTSNHGKTIFKRHVEQTEEIQGKRELIGDILADPTSAGTEIFQKRAFFTQTNHLAKLKCLGALCLREDKSDNK